MLALTRHHAAATEDELGQLTSLAVPLRALSIVERTAGKKKMAAAVMAHRRLG